MRGLFSGVDVARRRNGWFPRWDRHHGDQKPLPASQAITSVFHRPPETMMCLCAWTRTLSLAASAESGLNRDDLSSCASACEVPNQQGVSRADTDACYLRLALYVAYQHEMARSAVADVGVDGEGATRVARDDELAERGSRRKGRHAGIAKQRCECQSKWIHILLAAVI